jgi:sulfate transport system ATP-binding protein
MGIQFSNVSKSFDSFLAIDDISLEVPTGSLVALLGPSGCGKSPLLRMVAGLETIDRGRVLINGRDATGLSVQVRQVGAASCGRTIWNCWTNPTTARSRCR